MNVSDAWNKLDKVLTGLEKAGEGRVARMNHRKKTLTALRALRRAIDEEYPVVRKKVRRRKTPISDNEWDARLTRKGWVCAENLTDEQVHLMMDVGLPYKALTGGPIYTPKWVEMALKEGKTASQLAKIKKSRTEQRALNTLWVATEGGT